MSESVKAALEDERPSVEPPPTSSPKARKKKHHEQPQLDAPSLAMAAMAGSGTEEKENRHHHHHKESPKQRRRDEKEGDEKKKTEKGEKADHQEEKQQEDQEEEHDEGKEKQRHEEVGKDMGPEKTIVLALNEIHQHREKIKELEELVRHIAVQYGVDANLLLQQTARRGSESEPATYGAPGAHASPGVRVAAVMASARIRSGSTAVEATAPATTMAAAAAGPPLKLGETHIKRRSRAARVHPEQEGASDDRGTEQEKGKRDSGTETGWVHGSVAQAIAGNAAPSVGSEEKARHIMAKLSRLTGRRESLEEIGPLLHAKTAEEALRNGRILRAADHLKRVYGGRPTVVWGKAEQGDTKRSLPVPVLLGSSGARRTSKAEVPVPATSAAAAAAAAAGTSLSATAPAGDLKLEGSGTDSPSGDAAGSTASSARKRARALSQLYLPTVEQIDDQKIEKLSRLTGRRSSLAEIVSLLDPRTPDEAKHNALSLYSMEHLKKRFGQRPSVAQAKKTASFEMPTPRGPMAAMPRSPSMPSMSSSETDDEDD